MCLALKKSRCGTTWGSQFLADMADYEESYWRLTAGYEVDMRPVPTLRVTLASRRSTLASRRGRWTI